MELDHSVRIGSWVLRYQWYHCISCQHLSVIVVIFPSLVAAFEKKEEQNSVEC